MNLVYKHEKPLFFISACLSALIWLGLIIGTFGIALIYILLAYLFFLFAHSAFISHLKGSGVKISEEQYPDLHKKLVESCDKIGMDEVPDAYLLRTDFFNALATRFLGRNFIVLFTDVVDALETRPSAIDFYIGHELGHIHRKHLLWNGFLLPASIFPLLGAGLRRAEEYTCDRYGSACCESEEDIKAAISAIAAGDTRWKSINTDAYLEQISVTSGFWMSFNELTGDYPWLTKRMATSIAFKRGEEIKHPRRSVFAWILSLIVPRFGAGGMPSLLITVALVGILAAVAIPSYQDYVQRSKASQAFMAAQPVKDKSTRYMISNKNWPTSLTELGYPREYISDSKIGYEIRIYENGVIGTKLGVDAAGRPKFLVLEPVTNANNLHWQCYGDNIPVKQLPPGCK